MYNKGLFADWVPKPVQLLLILALFIPMLAANGVYTGNLSYMVGSLGTYNEWIVFANYATIVGMGTSLPLALRFKTRFRVRHTLVRTFILLALLMMVLGTTDNNVVIVAASFLVGFFKIFGVIEMVLPILFILSSDGNRQRFYSIFYPFAISIPQIVGYAVTRVGFYTSWEHAYFIMAIILLACAIISLIFTHNKRFVHKVPLYYVDWMGMLIYIITLGALAYFLAFARQQDYFNSGYIVYSVIIFGAGTAVYFIHQEFNKRPFADFRPLKRYNVIHGIMLLFMLGFFLAGSSVQSSITVGLLGYDALWNNSFNLWMIPGLVLGGVFGVLWLAKNKPIKIFVMSGYAAFLFYSILLYFLIDPNLEYQMLIIPNIIRGFGMVTLFIGVWYYALNNLSMNETLSVAAFLLVVRSMIAPGVWGVITNYMNDVWQLEAIQNLAIDMDAVEIPQRAAMGLYKSVRIQALIISTRRVLGAIILLGGVVLLYNVFLHFEGLSKRKIILIRKRLKGHETSGYIVESASTQEAIGAASAAI
jgi:MFS family permease